MLKKSSQWSLIAIVRETGSARPMLWVLSNKEVGFGPAIPYVLICLQNPTLSLIGYRSELARKIGPRGAMRPTHT